MLLFDGRVFVSYGQFYVVTADVEPPRREDAFPGQQNGLCGAACPGALFLVTGTHTGEVGVRVVLADEPPRLTRSWTDVVEAPLRVAAGPLTLLEWGGGAFHELDVPPGDYRVRYAARRFQAAQDAAAAAQPPDSYELTLWPTAPAADAVVVEGSEAAAGWHRSARGEPEPELPVSPACAASREAVRRLAARAREPLSGQRDRLLLRVEVPTTAGRAFRFVLSPQGWFGDGGSNPEDDAPGHAFDSFFGDLLITGTYRAVDRRRRAIVVDWSVRHVGGSRAPLVPPSTVRFTVQAPPRATVCTVEVEHAGLPVEELEDWRLVWEAQAERIVRWAETGCTGAVPAVEDWLAEPVVYPHEQAR